MNVLVGKHPETGKIIPVKIPEAKITGIVQCYQSEKDLGQCLESLAGRVDRIICIDGYFTMKNTPHYHPPKTKNGASTDESGKIARKYGAEWLSGDREYSDQTDKLNRIPELVPEGEWCFILDTDEELVSYVKDGLRTMTGWFSQWTDTMPIRIDEPYYSHPFTGQYGRNRVYMRLFRVFKQMRFENESCYRYPGRLNLYMGTMSSTVFIRHHRKEH